MYILNLTDTLIYDEIKVIKSQFSEIFIENKCQLQNSEIQFSIAHNHLVQFAPNHSPQMRLPFILKIRHEPGVSNILQVVDICLVAPLSSVKWECGLAHLSRIFSKERSPLKNETLEMFLHLRNNQDLSQSI